MRKTANTQETLQYRYRMVHIFSISRTDILRVLELKFPIMQDRQNVSTGRHSRLKTATMLHSMYDQSNHSFSKLVDKRVMQRMFQFCALISFGVHRVAPWQLSFTSPRGAGLDWPEWLLMHFEASFAVFGFSTGDIRCRIKVHKAIDGVNCV